MSSLIVLYSGTPSYKRVLFKFNEKRMWRFRENWKFNGSIFGHYNIILPFLRLTKCNGEFNIGLGNHYFIIGC